MLTDACFKEGLSATLKSETSLMIMMIIAMTIISETSKDLRKSQSYQKRSTVYW